MVDEAIAHEFGMLMPSAATAHAKSTADNSRGEHATEPRKSLPFADAVESEAVSEHGMPPAELADQLPSESPPILVALTIPDDENFETVVEGWTAGQESKTEFVPILSDTNGMNSVLRSETPISTRKVEPINLASENRLAQGTVVLASFFTGFEPVAEQVDDPGWSNWPFAAAIFVSAAASATAIAFDRRAERVDRMNADEY
jgi:hypothetical protein